MISESSQSIILDFLDKLEEQIIALDNEVENNINFESVVDKERLNQLLTKVFRAYNDLYEYIL